MVFRRTVAWLSAALIGAVAGSVAVAAPASADDFAVSLRGMPSSYRAGGSPGALTIAVAASRRKVECVRVLRALTIRLDGLSADRVRVEHAVAGAWRSMPVTDTGNGVRVSDEGPDTKPLCRGRTSAGRYRITFMAGAPGGVALFGAEAFSSRGVRLGQDTATRRVVGARRLSPTASPTAVPSSAPAPTQAPPAEIVATDPAVAVGNPPAGRDDTGMGLSAVVIGVGLLLVAVGIALLVFLVRRNSRDGGDASGPGGDRTMLLPTVRG